MKLLTFIFILISFTSLSKESPSDAFIFAQTPCFGTCPVYEITVLSDGTVIYKGESHVSNKGVYSFPKSPELFTHLLKVIDSYNFHNFRDDYGWSDEENICKEQWTDHSSTILTIQYAGDVKSVHHYHGCKGFEREDELVKLEKEIKELFISKGYLTR
ncbi:DUF6438 domain-containing protein [Thalassotalea ponticola]|uniref:DUF6438 domain-containing protein n=1 Tax=Thalassotalea ponticola TaxID=1523392 RepID=UPI0025B3FC7F|nr:DUF6438 domain-containing protein [Thalassotalea ponticola]MDN3653410.1 DUF6438 domain-containing protein [Thalassotalea ponticola]